MAVSKSFSKILGDIEMNEKQVSRLLGLLTNTKETNNLLTLIEEKDNEIDYLKRINSQLTVENQNLKQGVVITPEENTLFNSMKRVLKSGLGCSEENFQSILAEIRIKEQSSETNFKKGRSVAHVHS